MHIILLKNHLSAVLPFLVVLVFCCAFSIYHAGTLVKTQTKLANWFRRCGDATNFSSKLLDSRALLSITQKIPSFFSFARATPSRVKAALMQNKLWQSEWFNLYETMGGRLDTMAQNECFFPCIEREQKEENNLNVSQFCFVGTTFFIQQKSKVVKIALLRYVWLSMLVCLSWCF